MRKLLSFFLVLSFNSYAAAPLGVQGQSGTTTYPPVVKVPYNQNTSVTGGSLLETGNQNMLVNGEMEGLTTSGVPNGWTCTTGTCTQTTTSGEFSSGKAAMKIVPTANVLSVVQNVNTPAGIQSQGAVGIVYRIPATCSTAIINSKVDTVTQTSVPSTSLIFDDKFHSIEIPIVFGTTSAGIQIFAGSACTGNIFIDAAYVKQGIGTQNLMLDNVYSAFGDLTGVVTNENKDWINGNCTNANPSVCTFNTGVFTLAPTCTATPNNSSSRFLTITSTATTVSIYQKDDTGVATRSEFSVHCQKSGADYLNSSSNVYSQASSGGLAVQVFGAAAAATAGNPIIFPTIGSDTTNGAYSTSTGLFTAPQTGYYDVSAYVDAATIASGNNVYVSVNGNTAAGYNRPILAQTNVVNQAVSGSATVYVTAGQTISIRSTANTGVTSSATLQIKKSTGLSPIVGSFQDYAKGSGSTNSEVFSLIFGGAAVGNSCTTSPCPTFYSSSNFITQVTRSAVGVYTAVGTKVFKFVTCAGNTWSQGVVAGGVTLQLYALNTTNIPIGTQNASNASADMSFTGVCVGTY